MRFRALIENRRSFRTRIAACAALVLCALMTDATAQRDGGSIDQVQRDLREIGLVPSALVDVVDRPRWILIPKAPQFNAVIVIHDDPSPCELRFAEIAADLLKEYPNAIRLTTMKQSAFATAFGTSETFASRWTAVVALAPVADSWIKTYSMDQRLIETGYRMVFEPSGMAFHRQFIHEGTDLLELSYQFSPLDRPGSARQNAGNCDHLEKSVVKSSLARILLDGRHDIDGLPREAGSDPKIFASVRNLLTVEFLTAMLVTAAREEAGLRRSSYRPVVSRLLRLREEPR